MAGRHHQRRARPGWLVARLGRLAIIVALVAVTPLAGTDLPTAAIEAAAPAFSIDSAVVTPAAAMGGATVEVAALVQARAATDGGVVMTSFVASAVPLGGQPIEIARFERQVFGAWQTRRYQFGWTLPADLPPGDAALLLQVVDAEGLVRGQRQVMLPVLPADGAPPPTPTPPPPPDPTATPAPDVEPPAPAPPPAVPSALTVTGSAEFTAGVAAALDLMATAAPDDLAIVTRYVTEIRESSRNYSWAGSRVILISTTAARSVTYGGSLILHEAVHVRNYFTGDQPVYGCEGEAKSLRAQAAYLRLVGDPAAAAWVEGLIGRWC